jgi:hypothetical protein
MVKEPHGHRHQRLRMATVAMFVAISAIFGAAPDAVASSEHKSSVAMSSTRASGTPIERSAAGAIPGPSIARPLDASGCTSASAVISLCITVIGSSNYVDRVYTEKRFTVGYVNACDSVSLLVNGRVYSSSGRFCSPAGTYLSHTFPLYENFSTGTQLCTRWDSYPTHWPCETVH